MAVEQTFNDFVVKIAQEVADQFVAERMPLVDESIAAGRSVATYQEVFDKVTAETKAKVLAEVRAARDDALGSCLRGDLAAQVEMFCLDDDIEILPADYMKIPDRAFQALYAKQWSAYIPKLEQERRELIKRNTTRIASNLMASARSEHKKVGVWVEQLKMPPWVRSPETSEFKGDGIQKAVLERFTNAGYSYDGSCLAWQ
eukprot:TRINITY_DN96208_c0_g1_i1.p1 TRINITY_DN96208_c0_g1~~TRINITY_DN96208_c0_g1_i1.p1  ORF type:complete len:201 (+),score=49.83 TRINITY_DN96208_c0_g1_i1:67-669(+)